MYSSIPSQRVATIDSSILPSDQAYIDAIIDHGAKVSPSRLCCLESLSDKVSKMGNNGEEFGVVCTHKLYYRGEIIWLLQTRSSFNRRASWGHGSSCRINKKKGILRVRLVHKGRDSLGNGHNFIESREYILAEMIRRSGQARANEVMYC
mmetsp:Transcript_4747/g.7401  ORF Transcript_4747/g.7401 Transcript_4747/m.7401 type:complete len:150 (-) Transcript_4747:626-1075(-)